MTDIRVSYEQIRMLHEIESEPDGTVNYMRRIVQLGSLAVTVPVIGHAWKYLLSEAHPAKFEQNVEDWAIVIIGEDLYRTKVRTIKQAQMSGYKGVE